MLAFSRNLKDVLVTIPLHYAAVEKLGSKWSTLATYFSKDFHTKSAKFLTELSEHPNNLEKIKRIIKGGGKQKN